MSRTPTDTHPIRIRAGVIETIRAHSAADAPAECCGALEAAGGDLIDRATPIPNEAVDPGYRYRIGPDAVRAVEDAAAARGRQVLGFYHSHPRGQSRPSLLDLECAWPWYVYLILGRDGERAWRLREDRLGFDEVPLVVVEPSLEVA